MCGADLLSAVAVELYPDTLPVCTFDLTGTAARAAYSSSVGDSALLLGQREPPRVCVPFRLSQQQCFLLG